MTRHKGFTLAEVAVVVVIVALLLAGMMIPLRTQIELRNTGDTQRTLEQVKDVIIAYAQANGRLPCPADGSIASGVPGAGTEQLAGNSCTASLGVVPWVTLGVPESDAWGRRLTYRVSPAFADSISQNTWSTTNPPSPQNQTPACAPTPSPVSSSFALCTMGDIAVWTRTETAKAATPLVSGVAAVLVSHGKNGYGAWQANGIRLSPMPTGNDEIANVNGTTTAFPTGGYISYAFYSRTLSPSSSGCADPAPGVAAGSSPLCEYDDIVAFIPAPVLAGRMVSAGRLP